MSLFRSFPLSRINKVFYFIFLKLPTLCLQHEARFCAVVVGWRLNSLVFRQFPDDGGFHFMEAVGVGTQIRTSLRFHRLVAVVAIGHVVALWRLRGMT